MKGKLILVLILLSLGVFGGGFWSLWQPYQGYPGKQIEVSIQPGSSVKLVAQTLKKAQVIRFSAPFYWAARLSGRGRKFKQGRYQFTQPLSAFGVMNLLVGGREKLLQFTIPEGFKMAEIFELLRRSGFKNPGNYEFFAHNPAFLKSLGLVHTPPSLEGFLYPETYRFSPWAGERTILQHLVKMFQRKLPKHYRAQAKATGLSWYQAVILASIIEKETGKASERPQISAVFHNRLKRKMRLQTDPTVIYGIKDYQGNITRKHLKTYSPYNTYMIPGLPPTPIASPGLAALQAAVRPQKDNFLYFVGKGDGSHKFTKTYQAHNRAVRKYQRHRVKDYHSY